MTKYKKEKTYTLEQILDSKRYSVVEKSVLKTLINKNMTLNEVDNLLRKVKERKVI